MNTDRWLPLGYPLQDGDSIRNLYTRGDRWQLYTTAEGGQALAVDESLHQDWLDRDWLEPGVFEETDQGCLIWHARWGSLISSVAQGPYPSRPEQAEAFVSAMRRSRELLGRASFADALYIAQFSLLLPTLTSTQELSDAMVLGRWLTGGVGVPVNDTARIRRYAPWLTTGTLDRILSQLDLTADAGAAGVLEPPATDQQGDQPPAPVRGKRAEGAFQLAGRPALEQFFREEVLDIIDHEAEYKRMGIEFPAPALLYGPPGCGKTYAIEKLVEHLGWPVYYITSGSIGSKYVHETSRKVSELFDQAIAHAPSVIVIDELEAFLSSRENARGSGEIHMEEVAEFLRRIPDASRHRVLLFGMTNMLDAIDKAILRKGRFDHILEVGMPSVEEIRSLLESLLHKLPTEGDLQLGKAAARLKGRPISDVAFVVRQAGKLAVQTRRQHIDAELLSAALDRVGANEQTKRKIGFQ
ncbi:MAG: ATP-binding protein [Clostridia bacterium]|nr:ATP-binding protein [Clostridia bacterium]